MTTSLHGRQTASLSKLLGVANHCTATLEPVGDGWSVCLGNLFNKESCLFIFQKTKLIYMQPGCDYQLTINARRCCASRPNQEQLRSWSSSRRLRRTEMSREMLSHLLLLLLLLLCHPHLQLSVLHHLPLQLQPSPL